MPAGGRTRRSQQVCHRLAGIAGEGKVCADRLDGAFRQVQGFFERGRTLPPDGIQSATANDARRKKTGDFVNQTGIHEGSGQRAATFDEQAGNALGKKLIQRRRQVWTALRIGFHIKNTDAVLFEPGQVFQPLRGSNSDKPGWTYPGRLDDVRRHGKAYPCRIKHHPHERAVAILPGAVRKLWVIGQNRAGPDGNRIVAMSERLPGCAGGVARHPLGSAGAGGDASIQTRSELEVNEGAAFKLIDDENFIELRAFHGKHIRQHFDAGRAQPGKATSVDLWVGVTNAGHDALDAGGDDGFGTGWGASVVGAGFEIDVQGCTPGPMTSLAQRPDLGVGGFRFVIKTASHDGPVADDKRAHQWARADPSPSLPGKA